MPSRLMEEALRLSSSDRAKAGKPRVGRVTNEQCLSRNLQGNARTKDYSWNHQIGGARHRTRAFIAGHGFPPVGKIGEKRFFWPVAAATVGWTDFFAGSTYAMMGARRPASGAIIGVNFGEMQDGRVGFFHGFPPSNSGRSEVVETVVDERGLPNCSSNHRAVDSRVSVARLTRCGSDSEVSGRTV